MNAGLRWILIVVGLLAGNVLAVVILITSAGRADGDLVLPDYYQRAAHYDTDLAAANRSAELGWDAAVELVDGTVTVRMRTAAGAPLAGAQVTVEGYPRTHAAATVSIALAEESGHPGLYRGRVPTPRVGIWQLVVRTHRGDLAFVAPREVMAR